MYGAVMNQFDELMFDDYFMVAPNNPFCYEFADSEARDSLIEWFQDEGLLQEWKIIEEGWSSKEEKEAYKKNTYVKKVIDAKAKSLKIVAQLQVSIIAAEKELADGTCKSVRKTEMKLEKMREKLRELE